MTDRFIVLTPSANSPASKKNSGYVNLGLVELRRGFAEYPKMLSDRARGVKKIHDFEYSIHLSRGGGGRGWERLNEMRAEAQRRNDQIAAASLFGQHA